MGKTDGARGKAAPSGVQSVEIGFQVIEALSALGGPAPLRDIAKAADLSVSAAHRYLVSLVRVGVVVQESRGGLYDLGPRALDLGLAAIRRLDHHGHALEALEDLHRRVGHTAGLFVWGSHGPTLVRWKEADRAVTVNARPGHALPVTRSAAGRVFAAFLPARTADPFVADELAAGDGPERQAFDARRREVRESFVSVIRGDVVPGIDAIAMPVLDHDGEVRFVLSVWGSDAWIDVSPGSDVHHLLADAAAGLSRSFGYAGDYPLPARAEAPSA